MEETAEVDAGARRARLKALRAAADAKLWGASTPAVGPLTKLANPLVDDRPSTSQPTGGFYSDPMAQYETSRDGNRTLFNPLGPPGHTSGPASGMSLPPPPGPPRFGVVSSRTRFPPPPFPRPPPVDGGGGRVQRMGQVQGGDHLGDERGHKREREERNRVGMDAYVSRSMVEDPWRHLYHRRMRRSTSSEH
jgi:hypothetical protein